jgi:HK97 family phage portal protein
MGNIVELYPYSDAHVAPLLNDLGWVYAYRYQSGNITQDWPAEDVIHIQNPAYRDPVNMHKGVSPITVAWDKINTYNELQATIYSLVASNAIPSGILSAPGDVPISQVESLRAQLRKRKDANGKDRTDAIVLGNGMSYQQMGLDAQKLQAIETTQELETAICGAFRIHPAVVLTSAGLARSTYNNLASAYQEYTTLTRVPFWNALEEQLESGLRKEFPDVQLAFDTSQVQALQPDAATIEAQALQQFTANIITLNEARATLKYEDVENGDVFAYEQQPAGGFGAFAADEPEAKQSVETNADPIESVEGRKVKWHEPEAVKYWQKQEDVILKAAEATQADVAEVMKRVERAVMKQVKADRFVGVNKMVKAPEDAINIADLVRQFIAANEATQEALRTQIIEMTLESVGGDLTQVQSLTDQIRDEQIRKSTENMKESLNTAKKDVARVLEANAGKPVAEVQKSLLEKFTEMQTSRAKMIAVTTCKAQATVVQRQTVKRVNDRETDPKRKVVQVWLSQRDSDVRKTHKDLDGEWIEEGETFDQFVSGAGEGPGLGEPQEAINCRCTLRPVRRLRVQERN